MAKKTELVDVSEPAPEAAEPAPAADSVEVMLICDHVYLPENPTQPGWESCGTTRRYEGKVDGRRARVLCHPALAEFLQSREQAEIL